MTPSEFSLLARLFPTVESERIPLIDEELKTAPYCQTFHLLIARFKKDAGDPAATAFIQRAALYAADRPHLKHLLELNAAAEKIKSGESEVLSVAAENVIPQVAHPPDTKGKNESEANFDIADVLMTDLGILKVKTKAFVELTTEKPLKSSGSSQQAVEEAPLIKSIPAPPVKQPKAADENDLLLLEIKSSRKKIKPENTRKAEQIEIIDQFIKARQVTIRPPEKGMAKQDLTESADSYSENVISETLVDILVRQGKKDKAIDVLKKLIWKFPQKKHLFAARIQDLSK
jgi:hypothetical protein